MSLLCLFYGIFALSLLADEFKNIHVLGSNGYIIILSRRCRSLWHKHEKAPRRSERLTLVGKHSRCIPNNPLLVSGALWQLSQI